MPLEDENCLRDESVREHSAFAALADLLALELAKAAPSRSSKSESKLEHVLGIIKVVFPQATKVAFVSRAEGFSPAAARAGRYSFMNP